MRWASAPALSTSSWDCPRFSGTRLGCRCCSSRSRGKDVMRPWQVGRYDLELWLPSTHHRTPHPSSLQQQQFLILMLISFRTLPKTASIKTRILTFSSRLFHSVSLKMDDLVDMITLENLEQKMPRWDRNSSNNLYALVDMGR